MDKSKKILITSALPYVNNVPHLGNIIGCVLSADVFARFCRLTGQETLFICGADEHGTATEKKAKEEGISPRELCDKYNALHKKIYDWFNISFDIFGRTSTENHKKITQNLFKKVLANGYIEEDLVTQPYCTSCETFLADRFIEGTCPFCEYKEARGDQCDSCGKLLNPTDLQDPKCKTDGTKPEFRETNHLFLKLDKLQPLLEAWVKRQSAEGNWSQNSIRTTNAWFKEGLKKRAITRDLKWGINIPESAFEGRFKDKVFYVWFDAPIGYISITEQLVGEKYKIWWNDPENVRLYQFMGKDNIPFHSIIFPGSLLAAENAQQNEDGEVIPKEFTLPYHLAVTEYLNYEHDKFSKSRNIGVFGDSAQESGIASDIFRYVLLYNRPENADTQFTWKGFQERLNNELVANFGNLVNRTISFTNRFLDNKIASLQEVDLDADQEKFFTNYKEEVNVYIHLLEKVKIRDALAQFMKISSLGNNYFQQVEPWKTKTSNRNKCEKDLALLTLIIKDLATLIAPYLPDASKEICRQLKIELRTFDDLAQFTVRSHEVEEAKILFKKIDDEETAELRKKYGGKAEEKVEEKNVDTGKLEPSDVQLVVGKISKVEKHPKADKLYIETVDVGEEKPLQIVSGLVGHYTFEELQDKNIIVVRNLKPAKLRGVQSNGMLLAAEDEKGTVGLILAPDLKPGTRITTAKGTTPAKKEIDFKEFMTLTFVAKEGVVSLNGELLGEGKLLVDKVQNGDIR